MVDQISLFDGSKPLKAEHPIRLVELFAGIGAQAKALEKLGVPFEHYRICEFDKYAVASYNAVHGTDHAVSDITKIHAEDLGITETYKYTYIMTYSFPCQDLSNAGKQAGMTKGEGTRSGLLWEVERLLQECLILSDKSNVYGLPQILLMENVPQVHGKKNMADFQKWCDFLTSIGYTNKWQDLNAKDYGVPQNRNRCFMLSWLGDYSYQFPAPFELKLRLKDVLEDEVDEKYYLNDKAVKGLIEQMEKFSHTPSLTSGEGGGIARQSMQAISSSTDGESTLQMKIPYKDLLGGINEPSGITKTIRAGGRCDIHKKHSWDLVYVR